MFFNYPNLVDYELFSEMWEEIQKYNEEGND